MQGDDGFGQPGAFLRFQAGEGEAQIGQVGDKIFALPVGNQGIQSL